MCTHILPHEHELFVHELHFEYVQRRIIHEDKVDEAVCPSAVAGILQSILHVQDSDTWCIQQSLVDMCKHVNTVRADGPAPLTMSHMFSHESRGCCLRSIFSIHRQMPFNFDSKNFKRLCASRASFCMSDRSGPVLRYSHSSATQGDSEESVEDAFQKLCLVHEAIKTG
jgi:hypothetical protein